MKLPIWPPLAIMLLGLLATEYGCSSAGNPTTSAGREYGPTAGAEVPAWSPRGDLIAFRRGSRGEGFPDGIWLVSIDGGDVRFLTSGGCPEWSPDGARLALSYSRQIRVLTLETGDVTEIPSGPRSDFAAWSPSGDTLVYEVLPERDGRGGLWTALAGGATVSRITTSGRMPTWAGSHTRIAFRATLPDGGFAIHAVSPYGEGLVQLSGSEEYIFSPKWSPSGQSLAYCTPQGIKVLDMISGETRLLDSYGEGRRGGLQACSWSPDEKWLVYNRGDLWVVALDGTLNAPLDEVPPGLLD